MIQRKSKKKRMMHSETEKEKNELTLRISPRLKLSSSSAVALNSCFATASIFEQQNSKAKTKPTKTTANVCQRRRQRSIKAECSKSRTKEENTLEKVRKMLRQNAIIIIIIIIITNKQTITSKQRAKTDKRKTVFFLLFLPGFSDVLLSSQRNNQIMKW